MPTVSPAHVTRLDEAGGSGIVDIQHREAIGREQFENSGLRFAIVRQRVVVIQMVVPHVRDAGGRQLHTFEPGLAQSMARDFHHGVRAALVFHSRQPGGQFGRGGRGVLRRGTPLAVGILNRAEQTSPQPGSFENSANQPRRGRLAIGSGDANHLHPPARIAHQRLANPGQCHSAIGHDAQGLAAGRHEPFG